MSDKVKVIIEIPKEDIELIRKTSFVEDERTMFKQSLSDRQGTMMLFRLMDSVKNGIPLDDVKAEIKEKCDRINSIARVLSYPRHREIQELLCEILASIGKTDVCSEEKSDVPESDSDDISHIFDNVTQEEFEKVAKELVGWDTEKLRTKIQEGEE